MTALARLLRRVFSRVPASGLPPVFVAGRLPAVRTSASRPPAVAPDHQPRVLAP